MVSVALISNPSSTGNREILPRIRSFCAARHDIFHYEVEHVDQIGDALRAIARVDPKVLVINGGDGTVQATLTELYRGDFFGANPPPVAVLPNGKTNLIALDLGSSGDPLVALTRIIDLAKGDLAGHVVERGMISLSEGEDGSKPVIGMFLGGAGLADTILYCRNKIYPLGLPNGVSHVLAALAILFSLVPGFKRLFMLPLRHPMRVSLIREGQANLQLALLIVTTLEKLLFGGWSDGGLRGLKLMAVDRSPMALLRAVRASLSGRLGENALTGVHLERGDLIRIESERSSVILDGEEFTAKTGRPIVLRSTQPMPFLSLAV
jgi:Diacylglycerol kinase catalytic domain